MWNLLQWLDDYVLQNTGISDNWKNHHTLQEFWVEQAKRRDKFIRATNFHAELNSYVTVPDDLLTLTETHKQQIKLKFDSYTENFYQTTLWFLTRILADYEKAEDLNNPTAKAVLELREYVNQLFKQQYPDMHAKIEAELAKAKRGCKQKPEIVCAECGSQNVRSYGDRWKCNQCGRTFLKKPRFKHYHKLQ